MSVVKSENELVGLRVAELLANDAVHECGVISQAFKLALLVLQALLGVCEPLAVRGLHLHQPAVLVPRIQEEIAPADTESRK